MSERQVGISPFVFQQGGRFWLKVVFFTALGGVLKAEEVGFKEEKRILIPGMALATKVAPKGQ